MSRRLEFVRDVVARSTNALRSCKTGTVAFYPVNTLASYGRWHVPSRGTATASSNASSIEDQGRTKPSIGTIAQFCKNHGFVFPGSEIYNGYAGSFDYGPLGVLLKRNISNKWWNDFVVRRRDVVGLDSNIIIHPQVWDVAGHTGHFCDFLIECKSCNARHRPEKMIEEAGGGEPKTIEDVLSAMKTLNIKCSCGNSSFSHPKLFNLMLETNVGTSGKSYLRPETAQGIFINFANVVRSTRKRLPFGVGQIGKSFRNEISPSNFLFRTREFEQMEMEYFCRPEESDEWMEYWVEYCHEWLKSIGIRASSIRRNIYDNEDLAHYSSATTDLEYDFPFGWGELWGIAHRSDYDLQKHSSGSGNSLKYTDPTNNKVSFFPHVVEPAVGLDRLVLAVLCDAYVEEQLDDKKKSLRVVLKLDRSIAPYRYAVLPLVGNNPEINAAAEDVFERLSAIHSVDTSAVGSIGKRYRIQDALGTPECITVDRQTLEDGTVTVRDRDSMEQRRVTVDSLLHV